MIKDIFNQRLLQVVIGIMIIVLSIYWIWNSLNLLYLYHYTNILFFYIYPDWVLILYSILGLMSIYLGLKTAIGKHSIIRTLSIIGVFIAIGSITAFVI